jgi:hypothetical protein
VKWPPLRTGAASNCGGRIDFFLPKSRVDLTRPSPSMREGVSPDVDRWRYAPHALSGYGKAVAVEIAP